MPLSDLLVPPAWGLAADAWRSRRSLLWIAAACTGIAAACLLVAEGTAAFVIVFSCFCFFRSPLVPMADASTRSLLGADGHKYGRVRLWGSVGFVMASVTIGRLSAGETLVIAAIAVMYACSVGFARMLPETTPARLRSVLPQLRHLVFRGTFLVFVCGTLLYGAGHAMFDLFIGLHWQGLGFSRAFVGGAWALGVVFEIGLLWFAPFFMFRISAPTLLATCALVATARWSLIAFLHTGGLILAAQCLHAITFGLWYISMIEFVQGQAKEAIRSSLQSLMTASLGMSRILGFLIGGQLFSSADSGATFLGGSGAGCARTGELRRSGLGYSAAHWHDCRSHRYVV